MKPIDIGVTDDSTIYFHNASTEAQKMFFYLLCTGHYYCNSNYSVSRNKFDSFLIMYVKHGKGSVTIDGVTTLFYPQQAVLIDCYKPHSYKAEGELEIYWIHFDGNTSREYCDRIISHSGNVISIKNTFSFENAIKRIYITFYNNNKISEALISKYITDLLTEIITSINEVNPDYNRYEIIENTISYICENINNTLDLNELSSNASLSPYYFSRLFKKETGLTPHEYIISTRINVAKFYLRSSSYPIKQICFSCGFTSESNFCSSFKKNVGITPSEYRNNFLLNK